MKIAIFSDIHGNNIALQEAIKDAKQFGVDEYVVLGDLIGDFPFGNEVVETIKNLTPYVIKGNREQYVIDYVTTKEEQKWQNKQNAPIRHNYRNLSKDNLEYIKQLPQTRSIKLGNLTIELAHGSPERINERVFLSNTERIKELMANRQEQMLIVGHTHEKEGYRQIEGKWFVTGGTLGIYFQDTATNYLVIEENNGKISMVTRTIAYHKETLKQAILHTDILKEAPTWVNLSYATIYSGKDINAEFIEDSVQIKKKRGAGDGNWKAWNVIDDDIWDELHQKYSEKYHFIKEEN